MTTTIPSGIVGIGGSAGALNVYKTLLDHLPANTGMAFVIISHIHPEAYSQLALILSRHTKCRRWSHRPPCRSTPTMYM